MRQRDASQECRLSEVRNKLIYTAERKLQAFLNSKKVIGAHILSTRVDKLVISEAEFGSPVFTGKLIAEVLFIDDKVEKRAEIPVTVADSQPTIVETEVNEALQKATSPSDVPVHSSHNITASLEDFKIVDDGTKYLKIYHTAAYGDLEPIGAVSKDEYTICADKASLLKEMFVDEAIAWPAAIDFSGEFKEPTITTALVEVEKPYYVVKECESISEEVKAINDYSFKSFDNIRFAMENEKINFDNFQTRITQRATVSLTDALRSKYRGNFKIVNASTEYDPESMKGKVTIETELLDGKDTKLVPFEIHIQGESMKLPDLSQLEVVLKDAKIKQEKKPQEHKHDEHKKEEHKKEEHKKPPMKKEATPMAPPQYGYQEVLRMPKDFLPASLKEGDIVEVDGLYWKLSSKSEGQLSKERDTASHWTFTRVHGNDGKPVYKQESY